MALKSKVTLLIGNVYFFKGIKFENGKERTVDRAIAEGLENDPDATINSTNSRSRQSIEQDRFEIVHLDEDETAGEAADEDDKAEAPVKTPARSSKPAVAKRPVRAK